MFISYGEIESVAIPKDEKGESRDFGYVCFKSPDDAEKALEALNKKPLENGQFLIVNKFVSKKDNELVGN